MSAAIVRWLQERADEMSKLDKENKLPPGGHASTLLHNVANEIALRFPEAKGEYKYGNAAGLEAKLLPGEPWFALRAKDRYAVDAVMAYAAICETNGLKDHAHRVRMAAMQMINWRSANPDKVKVPD